MHAVHLKTEKSPIQYRHNPWPVCVEIFPPLLLLYNALFGKHSP